MSPKMTSLLLFLALTTPLASSALAAESSAVNAVAAPLGIALRSCRTPVTSQCVAEHFDPILRDAKNGDGLSAQVLFRSLLGCQSPLALAETGAHQPVTIIDTATGQRTTVDHDPEFDRHTRTLRDRCSNFSPAQIAQLDAIDWLAADAGNAKAQFKLESRISHEADENKKAEQGAQLLELLQRNVQRKNFESMAVLSRIYNEGVLVKQDRVKGLAYSLAYESTLDESVKKTSSVATQRLAARMTAAERAQAENLSHQIVQN